MRYIPIIPLLVVLLVGCHNDAPDCGCVSPPKSSISESNSKFPSPGILVYKRQIDSLDHFYNDSYWLTYPGYAEGLIVCNTEILGDLTEVKNYPAGDGAIVKFEGQIKSICGGAPDPLSYDLITLTRIAKYDYDPAVCGCNSPVWSEIPDSNPLLGTVRYKRQLDPLDIYYNNRYWITYVEPYCINCVHSMVVCNEDMMVEFENLRDSGASDTIRFAGQLQRLCMHPFAWPADYTWDQITLTKIEKD